MKLRSAEELALHLAKSLTVDEIRAYEQALLEAAAKRMCLHCYDGHPFLVHSNGQEDAHHYEQEPFCDATYYRPCSAHGIRQLQKER